VISYIFALSAAAIWSLTGLISTRAVRYFGSYNFNFLRLLGIIVLFTPYAYIHWSPIYFENSIIIAIALSSIIGIVIGDTFLYICLKRLGPRREALLFSIQIPCTILMADIFLNALPNFYQLLGCGLIFIGIIVAIQFNKTIKNDDLENIQGNKLVGLYAGIGLAVCQAIGIIIMKPILLNTDPITISYLRVLIAAIGMLLSFAFLPKMNLLTKMKDLKQTSIAILCGLMGMGVGMTLFIIALKNGNPGVVSALSSTMPIMIIPFLWIATKNYSGHLSVLGALITCIGAAIIFLS
jgi:drug/metabolite transporter (DMT)-like permease|tara:strand:- start:703 stop:1587 length:885 start_codon:yes stop_codon:yes gene_type:complete